MLVCVFGGGWGGCCCIEQLGPLVISLNFWVDWLTTGLIVVFWFCWRLFWRVCSFQVPMGRLRKRIATRLKDSQNTYVMLTTFNEVDMYVIFLASMMSRIWVEAFLHGFAAILHFMLFQLSCKLWDLLLCLAHYWPGHNVSSMSFSCLG